MKDKLLKQWEQDIDDYGDNAYLMWFADKLVNCVVTNNFFSNENLIECLEYGYSIQRKQSAEKSDKDLSIPVYLLLSSNDNDTMQTIKHLR
jgi:hypothetical protein